MENVEQAMERLARERLGFERLRPEQRLVVKALLEGRDTLVVMPTGSGKSAIFQLAGLLKEEPTVIISPLIALQRDQVESIEEHHLAEAAEVNSALSRGEREHALDELEHEALQFLFVAPEQFNNPETLERLKEAGPALFVVDEAHSISEWGHDFRPEYLRLGAVVEDLGHPTVLALTASASPAVREEIIERLAMRSPEVVVRGFNRPNIWLGVERFHDERSKHEALLERVTEADKPGIVYAATHKHVEDLASALRDHGIRSVAYHGGMRAKERDAAQEAFMADDVEVIVATSAFGLGIDKLNVRFVFHYDIPGSVDEYYQEIGRAGRDGKPARALLFYRPEDLGIRRFFAGGGEADVEQIERVAEALEEQGGPVAPDELREETGLSTSKLTTALVNLEDIGAARTLATGEVMETEEAADLHEAAEEAEKAEQRHRLYEQSRIEMMRGYAEVYDCRREYLLNYFGEEFDDPCGLCDNCDVGMSVEEDKAAEPFPINSRVVHKVWGEGLVQRYEGDTMVVLFDEVGYKTLAVGFVVGSGALAAAS